MKKEKTLQNLKIFAPKRKYNQPVGAIAIGPDRKRHVGVGEYFVVIYNHSKKTIYARAE